MSDLNKLVERLTRAVDALEGHPIEYSIAMELASANIAVKSELAAALEQQGPGPWELLKRAKDMIPPQASCDCEGHGNCWGCAVGQWHQDYESIIAAAQPRTVDVERDAAVLAKHYYDADSADKDCSCGWTGQCFDSTWVEWARHAAEQLRGKQ